MIVHPSRIGHQLRGLANDLRMSQINLGHRELGEDEDWHVIGSAGEPAFQNGWVQYPSVQTCGFYKDTEGKVHIRGTMRTNPAGSAPSGLNVFQLPIGYRPQYIENPQVIKKARTTGSASAPFLWLGTFSILTDGWCQMANGWDYDYVHLNDIVFWTL